MKKEIIIITPDENDETPVFTHLFGKFYDADAYHYDILSEYCIMKRLEYRDLISMVKDGYVVFMVLDDIYMIYVPKRFKQHQIKEFNNVIENVFDKEISPKINIGEINEVGELKEVLTGGTSKDEIFSKINFDIKNNGRNIKC